MSTPTDVYRIRNLSGSHVELCHIDLNDVTQHKHDKYTSPASKKFPPYDRPCFLVHAFKMAPRQYYQLAWRDQKLDVKFFQEKKLIRTSLDCAKCTRPMQLSQFRQDKTATFGDVPSAPAVPHN